VKNIAPHARAQHWQIRKRHMIETMQIARVIEMQMRRQHCERFRCQRRYHG